MLLYEGRHILILFDVHTGIWIVIREDTGMAWDSSTSESGSSRVTRIDNIIRDGPFSSTPHSFDYSILTEFCIPDVLLLDAVSRIIKTTNNDGVSYNVCLLYSREPLVPSVSSLAYR